MFIVSIILPSLLTYIFKQFQYQVIYSRPKQIIIKMQHNRDAQMEQDQMQKLMQQYQKKIKLTQSTKTVTNEIDKSRKKPLDQKEKTQNKIDQTNKKTSQMQLQTKKTNKLKFKDLPQQIQMYLIEIYQFGKKLFLTGIMDNGQTLNIVANELYKELYFVLRDEKEMLSSDSNVQMSMSEAYLRRAEEQIRGRLRAVGLAEEMYYGEMVDMQYVFEIGEIPRNRRKYYKVRFSFKLELNQEIEPDWEGQTYKYVIGTSYTALQLLIINKQIKGPSWIKINKSLLYESHSNLVQVGLCAQMKFPQHIEVINRMQPPTVRVMSFSIKTIVPATIAKKKYFAKDKDQLQIYAISYHICQDYKVSLKDQKPTLTHRTYYLQQLGQPPNKEYIGCADELNILARFEADILRYDPDFVVCHDAATILDTLICRLGRIDRNARIKFGRLKAGRDVSKTNQVFRINTFIAGRLLVDTFFHAKDMVKSIQYDLENMATYARPQRKFTGITEQQAKVFFNDNKPLTVVTKCRQQSQLTFQIMNHFQILQMTRSLSNICGNLWKRSLQNKRAERNEFLIMHQCKARGLIIPDKFRKEKGDQEEMEVRKKYQGGMVFEPEKGFYSDYILLLDFNSLYPSLIRQYNVCFSIIERPKLSLQFYYKSKAKKKQIKQKKQKKSTKMEQQNPQDDGLEQMFANVKSCSDRNQWGFLPRLIHNIVQQRKACKKKMKKASNPAQFFILQIQQKCYKVVANSIYGCLGFSVSRFYSRPLAALITKKGRDSLLSAKDIVSKRGGVRVIYGDTDSLMIEPSGLATEQNSTEADKIKNLKKVADELKSQINKQYTFLQIDIDGVFKPMILLMKKKYVANKLTNFEDILIGASKQPKFSLQFKGIQIVRRDGCKLARDVQQQIINIMVKSDDSQLDNRYQKIIDYFTRLKTQIKNKPLTDLLFSKQLSKKPKEYTNADHLPHVKVALDRIAAGQKQQSLVNHTIFYLICKPRDSEHMALARNAYDLKTYRRSQQFSDERKLEIDYDHYKSVVIEPIGRLLVNINDKIYDQLVDIMEIPKNKVKNVRDEDDNTHLLQNQGQIISNNIKNKLKQFQKQLGQSLPCPNPKSKTGHPCKKQIPLLTESHSGPTLTLTCPQCEYNICNVLYNKIRYKMKQMSHAYYNNRKRCRCTKTYELGTIVPCCDLDRKARAGQKSQVSFRLHNFLYLVLDVLEIGRDGMVRGIGGGGGNGHYGGGQYLQENYERMGKITGMVEGFLEMSDYENIDDVFSKLRI